ncbi:MAG: pyridoxal phosphate-dependent aminotransferase [Thermoplasmata archaeon]
MKDLSLLIKREINSPSPIREIMKMAEPQNIINMGLNPDDVISFGGGWVDHYAPDDLIKAYYSIISDKILFHKSGGYSPTSGFNEAKESIAMYEKYLFNENLNIENIIVGGSSSQLTIDLFRVLLDPKDSIALVDPTYANYFGQIKFVSDSIKVKTISFLDENWEYLKNKKDILSEINEIFKDQKLKAMLIASPDNPTSQIIPNNFINDVIKISMDTGTYLIFDYAYKTHYFDNEFPDYFSLSPSDNENIITMNSNSKWDRGLGRRMGWIEANTEIIRSMERMQQASILCPDSLHQMAFTEYMKNTTRSDLKKYIDSVRNDYRKAAGLTIKAIREHLGFKYLEPQGGLYVAVNVETDSDSFVLNVLKNTGVIFVPGKGFGSSMANGIRISYGPLVRSMDKIEEGLSRVGKFLHGK